MKKIFLAVLATLAVIVLFSPVQRAQCDTTNYPLTVNGIQVITLPVMKTYTGVGTKAAAMKFKAPFKMQVLSVSTYANYSGGGTCTLDVKQGTTSLLSAPVGVHAGAVTEASLSASKKFIDDESTVNFDLILGGTTPTWRDLLILMTVRRTN